MFKSIKKYLNKKALKDRKYSYLLEEYRGLEYVVFDCETTGLDVNNDEIISIGAVIVKDNKIELSKRFHLFAKSNKNLSEESIKIHKIRECDLENAKEIDEVIEEFLDFIKNRTLVGYYLEFDIDMVNRYIEPKVGFKLPNKTIEVSELYYNKMLKKYPNGNIDLRFDTILNRLNLPALPKHSALNDAIMTALMFVKLKTDTKSYG